MILPFTILAIAFILILCVYRSNQHASNFPPGPFRFPMLGNLPQIIWNRAVLRNPRFKLFVQYSKLYGKIFSLRIASYDAVVINDPKLIKEAWDNVDLCGRPKLHAAAARTGGVIRGILLQDGEEWLEQRRFTLRHLKDFGFGKKSMESLVMDEAIELINGLKKELGQPISTQNRFNIAVLNSLWSIVVGKRFSHDDAELKEILESINRSLTPQGLVFYMPWIKDYFPELSGWTSFVKEVQTPYHFLRKQLREKIQTFDGGNPEHFTDVYINEIKRTQDKNSSFYGKRGEETLIATLLDLFVAGAETTSTTLTYAFLYLALFPEKQSKFHEEIDRCIGSRYPTLEDRARMPYTEAVILETLRFSSMVPLGLFHKCLTTTEFHGFVIPKNTWIIANLYSGHHDKATWGDPETFRPERFLSPAGDKVMRHEALIPFSYGKRVCLGEALAKHELFLFLVSTFQQFLVTQDPSSPPPSTEARSTMLINIPLPHKLILHARK